MIYKILRWQIALTGPGLWCIMIPLHPPPCHVVKLTEHKPTPSPGKPTVFNTIHVHIIKMSSEIVSEWHQILQRSSEIGSFKESDLNNLDNHQDLPAITINLLYVQIRFEILKLFWNVFIVFLVSFKHYIIQESSHHFVSGNVSKCIISLYIVTLRPKGNEWLHIWLALPVLQTYTLTFTVGSTCAHQRFCPCNAETVCGGKKSSLTSQRLALAIAKFRGCYGYCNAVAPVMFNAMSGGMSWASQKQKQFFIQNAVIRFLTNMK